MRDLRRMLMGVLIMVMFQSSLVSCTDNGEIIKSKDDKVETQKTGHGEVGDPPYDDDEEHG